MILLTKQEKKSLFDITHDMYGKKSGCFHEPLGQYSILWSSLAQFVARWCFIGHAKNFFNGSKLFIYFSKYHGT